MYHKILSIGIFCADPSLRKALKSVPCPERFEFKFDSYPAFEPTAYSGCDIAILDVSLCAHPSTYASFKKVESKSILCADFDNINDLTEEDIAALDDVWIKPLLPALTAHRFAQLIEHEKIRCDLLLTQQYLDTMIDSIPELIWFKDARGAHLKVNESFCETVEKTKEQIEGRGHYYIWDITPDEYSQGEYVCLESEEITMAGDKTCLFDELVKTKKGMRQFKTYKSPLFDYDGSVMGTVGIAHDITDLSNIEAELELFTDSMPYAVVVLDSENTIINVNEKAEEYFAVERANVLGGDFGEWRRLVLGDAVIEANDFSDSSFFTATIEGVKKTFEINQRTISDVFGNTTGDLRIYRDITKERELERRVMKSANTDYLTDLYNRRYLYELLASQSGEPVALIYLDLDNFKQINDTYGHQMGDTVLIETSTVLRD
ncbi:MAG: PAS domain S-box protein, partial [Raoultibacter sp.]